MGTFRQNHLRAGVETRVSTFTISVCTLHRVSCTVRKAHGKLERNLIIMIIIHFAYITLFNDPKLLTEMKTHKDNKNTKRAMTVRGDKQETAQWRTV